MYNPEIAFESAALGKALLTGAVMGIYYDVFRIIRRIIRCSYANILAQDLFFWVTSAIFVFFVTIKINGGIVRLIFVAAVLGGWMFYMFTVGTLVMSLVDGLVRIARGIIIGLHNKFISPAIKGVQNRYFKQKKEKSVEFDNNFKNIA